MKFSNIALLTLSFFTLSALAAPVQQEKRGLKSCYKHAKLTQYWIPKEGDKDMTNDGDSVTLSGSKTKKLKTKSGKTIAKVSKTTYDKFQMEGTGLLKSGIMVNLDEGKDKFMEVDRKKDPYGIGSDDDIALDPWVSVASNDLKRGTTLYVKDLDGLKLPDGKKHNGCWYVWMMKAGALMNASLISLCCNSLPIKNLTRSYQKRCLSSKRIARSKIISPTRSKNGLF
ncbi:hypothetical protein RO3G_14128 [Lichtheimia corymbifera JMRC:FSU:9682]|uniref:Uncharacterized protein n=1 Tax=Lichtheimia corymbifera JMRC:FSU:9682 TaxID=1263082 RepID=A0A068SA27_9FUNG|nr:hypothetical protein RO3G_14128 [Lichtheimia corymbifera JMRC:FSU:9682]